MVPGVLVDIIRPCFDKVGSEFGRNIYYFTFYSYYDGNIELIRCLLTYWYYCSSVKLTDCSWQVWDGIKVQFSEFSVKISLKYVNIQGVPKKIGILEMRPQIKKWLEQKFLKIFQIRRKYFQKYFLKNIFNILKIFFWKYLKKIFLKYIFWLFWQF